VGVSLQDNKKTFRAQFDNLTEIAAFILVFCHDASLDDSSCYHIEMAVDEACSNIIEHAYGGEGKGEIEICVEVNPGNVTIKLSDHGKSFNPDDIPDPDLETPLEERKNHGLGLFFIRKLMDQVFFTHGKDHSNILTLVKYRK